MTARAGDALSHVYFSWPPTHLSKPIFQANFPRPFHAPDDDEPAVTMMPLQLPPEGPINRKLNGSARICIGAMNLRNRANLPPAVYLPQLGAPH